MPIEIEYLGWSSFRFVSENGTKVVTDPCLSGHPATGIPPCVVGPNDLADTDLLAVTHAAYDHAAQVIDLMKASQATLFAPRDVTIKVFKAEIARERVFTMCQGMRFGSRDILIKGLEAIHHSITEFEGQWVTGMPLSFMIYFGSGEKIFFAGDSALGNHFRFYGEFYRPDLAILPVGGGRVHDQFLTVLYPDEAAVASRWLNVKTVIPMHYLGSEAQQFQEELARHVPEVRAVIMEPGERLRFSSREGLLQ